VDDKLIIYNENVTDVKQVLKSFNGITPSLTFTLEQEEGNKLNFLDILIIKTKDKISFDIYRKKPPRTSSSQMTRAIQQNRN